MCFILFCDNCLIYKRKCNDKILIYIHETKITHSAGHDLKKKSHIGHSSHILQGKEVHVAFTQQIFIKHILCTTQYEIQRPLLHKYKNNSSFCAFTNKVSETVK